MTRQLVAIKMQRSARVLGLVNRGTVPFHEVYELLLWNGAPGGAETRERRSGRLPCAT